MESFFDPRVWGMVLLWRVILGALVLIPPLYFIIQICLDFPAASTRKEKGLSRHVVPALLKKLFRSPRNILLACVWLGATVYVFGVAYVWPLGAKALPYRIFEINHTHRNPEISLLLENPFDAPSGADVAATCMAAGKYYAPKLRTRLIRVKVFAFPPTGFYYGRDALLGQCTYADDPALDLELEEALPFRVADKVSPTRLKINQLWGALADEFRDTVGIAALDTSALSKKISCLTGAPLEEAKLKEISLQPVVEPLLPQAEAKAPLNPEREKILPQIMKIKDFADRLRLWIFERCFLLGEKIPSAQKKAIHGKFQEQLGELEKMLLKEPTLPAALGELPGLFNEYADSCSRNARSELALSKVYSILNRE